jgi:hypothetical protein
VHDGIGMQVLQAVLGQAELIEDRARLNEVVRGRAGVVQEPRQRQLLRAGVPADILPSLQDKAGQPGPGEISGGDQAVVTRTGHDDVERLAHRCSAA